MSVRFGDSIATRGLIFYLNASSQKNYVLSEVEVLVVAGGGAGGGYGGNDGAGGGGAGGLLYSSSYPVTPGSPITATVGNGGAGVGGATRGNDGQNSVFGILTAIGGGGGGTEGALRDGKPGGSGGGAGGYGVKPGGAGTAGQGFAGGNCTAPGDGGGGGAGGVGENGLTGRGGIGLLFNISGTPTYYAGGGGASGDKRNVRGGSGALGGFGGGGKGQDATNSIPPENGTNGLGGGGGAAAGSNPSAGAGTSLTSGAGGSGVVIVRYPGPQKATGGTITSVGGYTIHTFTTSGTFTPLSAPANAGSVYGLQDLSGNNNTAIQSGGVTYSTSNRGSFIFDGVNDYVDVTTNLGVLSGYTFCHWSRRDAENRMPIGWRAGPTFYQFGDNSWFYTHGGVSGEYYYPKSVSIPVGTWGFYCITYDGSAVRIYRNAVLEGSQATTGTANWTNGVRIGFWSGGPGYYYQGAIANVAMYDRALTSTEIEQYFNVFRGRFGI